MLGGFFRVDFHPVKLAKNYQMVADVWEQDVWEFRAKSGSSGSCRLFLRFLGKIAVQEMSGKTPGSPRHPSSRHPLPSEISCCYEINVPRKVGDGRGQVTFFFVSVTFLATFLSVFCHCSALVSHRLLRAHTKGVMQPHAS